MSDFSATDAALEGFRLTRERPRIVLVWAGLLLLASLIAAALIFSLAGEAFTALSRGAGAQRTPEETFELIGQLGPFSGLLIALWFVFYAVLYSAVYRAVLRPEEGGPGYLKLGGDELRVAATMLLLVLLLIGATIVVGLAAALIIGLLASGGAGSAMAAAALLPLLLLVPAVYLGVRFSLALPATFAERRIVVWRSWSLTKGRFWPLLGTYVLSLVLGLVVYLLALMIYFAVAALVAGGVVAAGSVFQPDYTSLSTLLTPAMILYLLIISVIGAVLMAITNAPPAVVYRDITGYGARTADVFS
jgi:hypothetical protein